MTPVMRVFRLVALLSFCLALAGSAIPHPVSSAPAFAAERGSGPLDAPAPIEEPCDEAAESFEETEAKHLGCVSAPMSPASSLALFSGSGASPLDTSLPPLFPPPPNRA
jgi:hypothetical protein